MFTTFGVEIAFTLVYNEILTVSVVVKRVYLVLQYWLFKVD